LVGAPSAGAAYMFDCTTAGCVQTAKLVQPQPTAPLVFGYSVALSRSRALVGAPNTYGLLMFFVFGRVTEFDLVGTSLQPAGEVVGPYGNAGFGTSLALGPTRAVVGVTSNTDIISPGSAGAVAVYDRAGAGWTAREFLVPSVASDTWGLDFGSAVAFTDN